MVEQVTCPLPVGEILGGERAGETSKAYPLMSLNTEWNLVERYREILTQSKDIGWGLAERCQGNCPPSGKVLGSRG